ncbi:MAG: molecular chaperone DnaJ [Alphaproteobacteria bacterium]
MAKQDYYELLGIQKGATDVEIKKAYRSLAMKYHPDRNPGDAAAEVKFREVTEAYEVLKDGQKRAAYDRYGHAAFAQGAGAGAGFGGFNFDFGGAGGFGSIFEDIFSEFMGGAAGRRSSQYEGQRGADIRYDLEITLEEAFAGVTKEIEIQTAVRCEDCGGTGAAEGSKAETCDMCRGTGRVRRQSGFFIEERMCPSCQGTGKVIKNPCRKCRGTGKVSKKKVLEVNIPAGIDSENRMRLSGQGEAGLHGGPNGDLYIFVHIRPHKIFRREGTNLFCDVPVSMVTAALGGEMEIPCLDGTTEKVVIDAGTQSGHEIRLRKKGMTVLQSKNIGDLFVRFKVETPTKLTVKQKELLKQFEEDGKENCPESAGFFEKLKDFIKKG